MRRFAAICALALMIAGVLPIAGAQPAVAHDADSPPGVTALNRPDDGFLTRTYPTRGCDGVVGGPKPGADGWVFQRPVTGAIAKVYGLLFATSPTDIAVLRIDASGVHGVNVFDITSLVEEVQRPPGGPTTALPAGVTGGLIDGAGAWAQTPAGWRLVDGALYHGNVDDSPAEFSLLAVCSLDPVAPVAAPTTEQAATPASAPPQGVESAGTAGAASGGTPVLVLVAGALILLAAGLVVARRLRGPGRKGSRQRRSA